MVEVAEKKVVLTGSPVTVDFEKDAFAEIEIDFELESAAEVKVAVSERANPDGSLNHDGVFCGYAENAFSLPAGHCPVRVTVPDHHSPFEYVVSVPRPAESHGEVAPLRFVRISGGEGRAVVRRRAFFGEFDERASHFESSNSMLNRIWEFSKYTLKATSAFGFFIDGQRERVPYEGDGYVNMLGWFACSANGAIARRSLDWFSVHPTWFVDWHLLSVRMAHDYWMYSGDEAGRAFDLTWLPKRLASERCDFFGLINDDQTHRELRDLVDWPPVERDDYEFGKINFVPNAHRIMAREALCAMTGNMVYHCEAEQTRYLMRKRLVSSDGMPLDCEGGTHTALQTALMAALAGVLPASDALNAFVRAKGMACSVYFANFLLEYCFRYGMAEHALDLLTSEGPRSWFNMIREGATISTETWQSTLRPREDWNHAWGAAPAHIIPHWLCGVRPVKPTFREFVAEPAKLDLDWHLEHPTPFGAIKVDFERGKCHVEAPAECRQVEG